jgi:phospholipase/lecithinase/hemolysin
MKRLLICAVILAVLLPKFASADLIVFGDSLSDTGNFYLATGGTLPPSPPYDPGRFSNGPVWVEYLANELGVPAPLPSLAGGTNFAWNGAMIQGVSPYSTPDMTMQVQQYLGSLGGSPTAASDIYVLWGGANDIFFSLTGQTTFVTPAQSVQAMSDSISTLAGEGANEFVIPNLPPLGETPFFNGTGLAGPLNAAAAEFNLLLAAELETLATDLNIKIHQVDVDEVFSQIQADPAAFGLDNITDSATQYDPTTGIGFLLTANDPDSFLYFDSVHPTTIAHQLIGLAAARTVIPEPASILAWLLLSAVVVSRRYRLRK